MKVTIPLGQAKGEAGTQTQFLGERRMRSYFLFIMGWDFLGRRLESWLVELASIMGQALGRGVRMRSIGIEIGIRERGREKGKGGV